MFQVLHRFRWPHAFRDQEGGINSAVRGTTGKNMSDTSAKIRIAGVTSE